MPGTSTLAYYITKIRKLRTKKFDNIGPWCNEIKVFSSSLMLQINKLACFSAVQTFQPNLIFVGEAWGGFVGHLSLT